MNHPTVTLVRNSPYSLVYFCFLVCEVFGTKSLALPSDADTGDAGQDHFPRMPMVDAVVSN